MKTFRVFYLLCVTVLIAMAAHSCASFDDNCCEEDVIIPPDTIKLPPVIIDANQVPYRVTIQIGAFRNKEYADEFYQKARTSLGNDVVLRLDNLDGLFKIEVGDFEDVQTANNYLSNVTSRGYPDAFVHTVAR
jgi:cell division septation protein DedD